MSSIKTQERLVNLLALIAGYVDAYGYITFSTYLSFMSGNTTQTGYHLGKSESVEAVPFLAAIFFFVFGVFIGTLFNHSGTGELRKKVFAFIGSLLLLTIIIFERGYANDLVQIALLAFAMGVMNTVIRQVGTQSISLTFVTGTLNRIARHMALKIKRIPLSDAQGSWDTHERRVLVLARIWGAFLVGATLSGALTPYINAWALLLPIFILFMLAVFNPPTEVKTPEY